LIGWNDVSTRTHAEVLALLDRTLAEAEEKAHAI
jgi:hypothetical protein